MTPKKHFKTATVVSLEYFYNFCSFLFCFGEQVLSCFSRFWCAVLNKKMRSSKGKNFQNKE
jgi:hypothetical protein